MLNVHHVDPPRPVPAWIHTIIITYLGRILCMRASSPPKYQSNEESSQDAPRSADGSEICLPVLSCNKPHSSCAFPSKITLLSAQLQSIVKKINDDEYEAEVKQQWKLAARILDRMFFIIYLLLIIVTLSTMVFLYPLTKRSD